MENSTEQLGSEDIFNLNAESFLNPEIKKGGFDVYEPKADKGTDGKYVSVVRFLPNYKNLKNSKIHKYEIYLRKPGDEKGFYVDCPSIVGKKSILKDAYWKLAKSDSARDKDLAKNHFGRMDKYYSLVQIVEDNNQPDLVGKIMIFKFGTQINTKIEALLKPKRGAVINPYSLFDGKDFVVTVVKKQNWNNYEQSEFSGDKCPITLPGDTKPIEQTEADKARVLDWLKANSPDLEKYEFKDWTPELNDRVMETIAALVPESRLLEGMFTSAGMEKPVGGGYTPEAPARKAEARTSTESAQAYTEATAKIEETKTDVKPSETTHAAEDLEDLYADL